MTDERTTPAAAPAHVPLTDTERSQLRWVIQMAQLLEQAANRALQADTERKADTQCWVERGRTHAQLAALTLGHVSRYLDLARVARGERGER